MMALIRDWYPLPCDRSQASKSASMFTVVEAWLRARARAVLPPVGVHDLMRTFGRRLRADGVSFEDGQDPLGHRSARIITHYPEAELAEMIEAAN